MQDQISRSSRSASPIHSSTEQKTIFVNNYSNVRVVRSITRFDGARLSYALVRSNCNKLVITWPLGRLANLSPSGALRPQVINQPAPSWPCYNYYLSLDLKPFLYTSPQTHMHNIHQYMLHGLNVIVSTAKVSNLQSIESFHITFVRTGYVKEPQMLYTTNNSHLPSIFYCHFLSLSNMLFLPIERI